MKIPETLKTERLTILKFKTEDKPRFIEFMTDKESTKYLEFSTTQKNPGRRFPSARFHTQFV